MNVRYIDSVDTLRRRGGFGFAMVALLAAAFAPAAPVYEPLDLSAHHTVTASGTAWPFPRGTQVWASVPFRIEGRIEVTGMDAARSGEFLPPQVRLPVNRKAARLHLVHAARHGTKEGVPLANVVLNYRNGDRRVRRLAFGVHAGNSHGEATESAFAPADPNSAVAWTSGAVGGRGPRMQMFSTPIDNPQPDDEIASIDFESLFSRATPMLFALTLQAVGNELRPLVPLPNRKMIERANEFADPAYRRELRVHVTTGAETVTNATATVMLKDDERSFYFGQYTANATGAIVIAYPPADAVSLNVRVSSPGFVPAARTFAMNDAAPWPETIDVRLERGQSVGGVVVDPDGKPVAGAAVIPFEVVPTGPDEYARTDFDLVPTGADGKWTTALGHSISNISFEVRHAEHRTRVFGGPSPDVLLAGTTRFVVDPETRIAGRVVNARQAPIAGARVALDAGGESRLSATSDAAGRFSLVVRDRSNGSATLVVMATNLAPVQRRVALADDVPPLGDIVLPVGETLTMKIVDNANRPATNLMVTLIDWEGSEALEWSTRTGPDGRFRWEHAPAGRVRFRYEKPGSLQQTHTLTLPLSKEITFNYSAPVRIAGYVVDAESGQPIDRFRARIRYQYNEGRSSGSTTMTGSRGRFSTYLGTMQYEEVTLLFEARGYEPFTTNLPPMDGTYSNVFHLARARLIPGFVRAPDGSPAAKAEVVLIDESSSAYMDEPGRFRRTSTVFETVVADGDGRFELTPKLDASLVLAAHPELGFAELPFRDLTNGAPLVLKPWGRVEGVLRIGDKLEPHHYAALHSMATPRAGSGRTAPAVYTYLEAKPGPDGRFSFEAVPPGMRVAYLRHKFSERESGPMKLGHGVPITVQSGKTNHVVIGGNGRTVIGRIEAGNEATRIDWRRQHQTLQRRFETPIPAPLTFPPNATAEQRRALMAERTRSLSERMYFDQVTRVYSVVVEGDGKFHAHNIPPGRYTLHLAPSESLTATSFRTLGSQNKEVVIPEGEGPHDLGVIPFSIRR